MSDEETVPYFSCALCGKPVAPFGGAVWLSEEAMLCPPCSTSLETLPRIEVDEPREDEDR